MSRKILVVTPFLPPDRGGLANHVSSINLNLVKQGFDVSIITPKHLRDKLSVNETIFTQIFRINSVYLPPWPYTALKSISIPTDFGLKINSVIKNGNFDLVHVHGNHYPSSWIAIDLAFKHGVPLVLTMHGIYGLDPEAPRGKSWVEGYFYKYVFPGILKKTKAVIGLTQVDINFAKRFGIKSTKYFTIPNGVDTVIYDENMNRKKDFRKKYQIGEDKSVILFCGRFEKVKGIIEFAKAAKNLVKNPKIEIVIVGGGSLDSLVHSLVGDVNGIHLLKWQPSEIIHELYIASDIFVIPSQIEGLPLTVIEAMNSGLHIVFSPVGGIPEVLEGYSMKTRLVEVTPIEIEKILTDIISNLPVHKSEESIIYARKFDWSNLARETGTVYSQILQQTTI